MGYERAEARVYAFLSRHNSDQDRVDDALWDDFAERLRALASDEKYKPIGLAAHSVEVW